MITVEPIEEIPFSACFCCVRPPEDLRGAVYQDEAPHAIYSAEPAGDGEHRELLLTIAFGPWDERSSAADRRVVGFVGRGAVEALRPSDDKAVHWEDLVRAGRPIGATELAAEPDFAEIRALALAIAEGDPRIGAALSESAGRRVFTADAPLAEAAR